MSDKNHKSPKPEENFSSGVVAFWQELKRRKVMRVAITYAVVAWLIIQVAVNTFPYLLIPEWALRLVIMLVILGFPVSLIVAWAFELTPDGIKTTRKAEEHADQVPITKKHQQKRNWFWLLFGAAIPTLIFGILALFFYIRAGGLDADSFAEKSIAVLPLTNMSPDPENAFFADGVQEDILTNLSKIKDLLVISRSSTLQYRNPQRNLKQIGEELNARFLVEGSVRRADNQVQVTAQLIDTRTDGHIWADNFSGTLDQVFTLQASIAKEIANQLHAALSPETIAQIEYRPTDNQEAYDLYQRALLELSGNASTIEMIRTMEKVVALDPNFAEAWAILTEARVWAWHILENRNDPELLKQAHVALDNAKRLGPNLPHPYWAHANVVWHEEMDAEVAISYSLRPWPLIPPISGLDSIWL